MAYRRVLRPPGARLMTTKPLKGRKLYHKSLKSQEKSQNHHADPDPQKISVIRGLQSRSSAAPDPANQPDVIWPQMGDFRRNSRAERPRHRPLPKQRRCAYQLSSMRRSRSTSSAKFISDVRSSSTFFTACMTVVWSRPPNFRPISGNDREVSCLDRYIAT